MQLFDRGDMGVQNFMLPLHYPKMGDFSAIDDGYAVTMYSWLCNGGWSFHPNTIYMCLLLLYGYPPHP